MMNQEKSGLGPISLNARKPGTYDGRRAFLISHTWLLRIEQYLDPSSWVSHLTSSWMATKPPFPRHNIRVRLQCGGSMLRTREWSTPHILTSKKRFSASSILLIMSRAQQTTFKGSSIPHQSSIALYSSGVSFLQWTTWKTTENLITSREGKNWKFGLRFKNFNEVFWRVCSQSAKCR